VSPSRDYSAMKTIGLCMIVKNEAGVILRCLESARSLVDYALVEDTGSSDGTQEIIRDYLRRENLPGEVFDAPARLPLPSCAGTKRSITR
jgi:glycosyltransferase involved in cell wall biosynthesis